MPGIAESLSGFQSQDVRDPSSTGSPSSLKVAAPSAVSQTRVIAFETLGTVPISAYNACPPLSDTIVLTHGMPSYFLRIASSWLVDVARSVSKKWLKTRKLSTFASRIANAVAAVHGKGMPRMLLNTGPYLVHHNVCVTVPRLPSAFLTVTETVRGCILVGCPSTRYEVGFPGTSVSWYGVNRNAVETVWLHASVALCPISTIGTPNSD